MPNFFKEYFTFTRGQQNGIIVLVLLIAVLVIAPYLIPLFVKQPQVDFSAFKKDIEAFENETASDETDSDESTEPESTLVTSSKISKSNFVVELNSADSAQLDALKGIGAVLSKRIVKFRGVLGGFTSIDQLKEVYGLDTTVVEKIKPSLTLDTSLVVKIPINTISEDSLKIHPYFRKNIAREIVAYREKHGPFGSVQDLRKVDAVDEKTFRKVKPYVKLE